MKKNIFPFILTLIVGLAAGYLIRKTSEEQSHVSFSPSSWTGEQKQKFEKYYEENTMQFAGLILPAPIHNDTAKAMIKDFVTENDTCKFPLMAVGQKRLNGFYIDKPSLMEALSVKGATGVSFYFARAKGTRGPRRYTLVYLGARNEGTDSIPHIVNGPDSKSDYQAQDYVKPCPDHCGSFK